MDNQLAPINYDSIPDISERMAKILKSLPKRRIEISTSMLVSGCSKYVTVQLRHFNWSKIELLHITDVQWGNPQCNKEKLEEYREWVTKKPYRFTVLGGDMCDLNTMLSVGKGAMEQDSEPSEQVLSLAEFLSPIAHRILGYVGGNHEQRGQKVGHDFGAHLAGLLRVPYSDGVQAIDLYYGDWKPFKIYLWHGRGGARTMGSKAQAMMSVIQNDRANLYISGHTHTSLVLPGFHVNRNHKKKHIIIEKYYAVSSTSFQNYYGTYAERAYYPPTFLLMGAATIYPNRTFRISI